VILVILAIFANLAILITCYITQVCYFFQISTFTGIGALVLEAGLDKFFDRPAVRETFEVVMAFSSLGDPSKNKKDKQIGTYHCNDFGNDRLWLAVPRNGEVKPGLRS
jgi:hypothetical protein